MSADLMRCYLNLVESVSVEKALHRPDFELHHNPSKDEFLTLFDKSHYVVRALIAPDGELYAWDADAALHSDVDQVAGTSGWMSFIIYDRFIDSLDQNKRALRAALKMNPAMVESGVVRLRMVSNR